MALGANITAVNKLNAWDYLLKLMNNRHNHPALNGNILKKAGIPASNTAADDPEQAGRFIIDTTNETVYYCSAYTNSTTFTIVQLA